MGVSLYVFVCMSVCKYVEVCAWVCTNMHRCVHEILSNWFSQIEIIKNFS